MDKDPSILYAGRLCQSHWSMDSHSHANHHEIVLVRSGTTEVEIRGQLLRASKGQAMFYPAGEAHAERSVGDEVLETFFLQFAMRQDPFTPQLRDWPLLVADRQGRMLTIAMWIAHAPKAGPANHTLANSLLYALGHEYSQCAHSGPASMVQRIAAFVQSNLSGPLALADLAAHVALSPYHFSRVFAGLAGQSPMQFVRHRRVEAAHTLLLTTPMSLKSIASQVGFCDEYHLSRVVKQVLGQSPRDLRKAARHGLSR